MRDGRIRALALPAVVIAATLSLTAPAESRPDPDRSLDSPAALPAAVAGEDECDPMLAADTESAPKRLIGQVAAVDHGGGRVVLATRTGPVALQASQDTMNELSVGDVLVVELTPEPDALVGRDCP
jgi:hypothetical protein